jgi:hypothetical protein
VPYLHLGYIATTTWETPPGLAEGGLAMVLVGAAVAGRLRTRPGADGRAAMQVELRRSRLGKAGLVLLGGGVALLVLAAARLREVPRSGGILTRGKVMQIQHSIEFWRQDRAVTDVPPAFVAGTHDLAQALTWFPDLAAYSSRRLEDYCRDAWGTPMQVEVNPVPGEDWPRLRILSAGKDMKFGTSDDLQFEQLNNREGFER